MMIEAKIKEIVFYFGSRGQISKAVEELIELAEILIKDVNKSELNKDHLYEELADVEIMLAQLKYIYNIDPEGLNQEIDRKIERTIERITDEGIVDCSWK
jgi:NTP pyrophosphatase (non-canonical NTP hydrolase)